MTSLREARTNRLLSMRELGRLASVAASTIYLIEAGRTTPRPSIVRKLAAALEVEPQDIDEFRRAIEVSRLPASARRRGRGQPSADDTTESRRE
jgi:transcriptional regulator with XRE-family HTH domain